MVAFGRRRRQREGTMAKKADPRDVCSAAFYGLLSDRDFVYEEVRYSLYVLEILRKKEQKSIWERKRFLKYESDSHLSV